MRQRGEPSGGGTPPTVPCARDTLGPVTTVGPAVALPPGGERAARAGMDGWRASRVAVQAEGEITHFLWYPQTRHTRARCHRDVLALYPPQLALL
jgi:hypothetical protein